ncbi:M23 family metallopeptidase [Actinoplanes sp. NPDC051851]|uniref:M23 family metallopeptidase n=1 Tax=Actinoplanes sp. NPDC051851 TaxID=3154753 RepID=UPI0034242117
MGQDPRTGKGRRRRDHHGSHRAPAFPALFASRGRAALSITALTATLATGVGAVGATATAAPSGSTAGHTAAHAPASLPIVPPAGDDAPGKVHPRLIITGDDYILDEPVRAAGQTTAALTDPDLPSGTAVTEATRIDTTLTEAARSGTALTGTALTGTALTGTALTGAAAGGAAAVDPVLRRKRPVPAPAAAPVTRKARPVVAARWVNPLPQARVTSCFGQRWGRLHAGVDLATAWGTPIVAAGAGVVIAAGAAQGYGNAVLIDHGDGYLTHYGHMSVIRVTVGQHVQAGQQIGDEGSTGHSTGPHLHFEVHEGYYKNPVEPTAWMHAHGVDIPGCSAY